MRHSRQYSISRNALKREVEVGPAPTAGGFPSGGDLSYATDPCDELFGEKNCDAIGRPNRSGGVNAFAFFGRRKAVQEFIHQFPQRLVNELAIGAVELLVIDHD